MTPEPDGTYPDAEENTLPRDPHQHAHVRGHLVGKVSKRPSNQTSDKDQHTRYHHYRQDVSNASAHAKRD
jgi:hypothetical protein